MQIMKSYCTVQRNYIIIFMQSIALTKNKSKVQFPSVSVHLSKSRPLGGDVDVELRLLADGNDQHTLSLHVEVLLATHSNLSWGRQMQTQSDGD